MEAEIGFIEAAAQRPVEIAVQRRGQRRVGARQAGKPSLALGLPLPLALLFRQSQLEPGGEPVERDIGQVQPVAAQVEIGRGSGESPGDRRRQLEPAGERLAQQLLRRMKIR